MDFIELFKQLLVLDIRLIVNLTAQPLYYRADLGFCSGRVMATGHCWYLYPSYAELENPGKNDYSQKCVVYPITVRQRKLVIIREDPPGSTVTNQLSPELENNFFHRLRTHQILIQIPTHRDNCSLPSISPARGFRSSTSKPFLKHQASNFHHQLSNDCDINHHRLFRLRISRAPMYYFTQLHRSINSAATYVGNILSSVMDLTFLLSQWADFEKLLTLLYKVLRESRLSSRGLTNHLLRVLRVYDAPITDSPRNKRLSVGPTKHRSP